MKTIFVVMQFYDKEDALPSSLWTFAVALVAATGTLSSLQGQGSTTVLMTKMQQLHLGMSLIMWQNALILLNCNTF